MPIENPKLRRLRKRVRKMVRDHPEVVIDALIEDHFWPDFLSTEEVYRRFSDDDNSSLQLVFSHDGDAWVESLPDPEHVISSSPRFRTGLGGGVSLRTRTALLVLARAIAKDNAERPR